MEETKEDMKIRAGEGSQKVRLLDISFKMCGKLQENAEKNSESNF